MSGSLADVKVAPLQQLAITLVVFALNAVVAWAAWEPFSVPVRTLAPLGIAGSLTVAAGLMLLGKGLGPATSWVAGKLPAKLRFLLGPLSATALFCIIWAGGHYDRSAQWGLLPQLLFPALVGLFAFVVGAHGPTFQRWIEPFLHQRDRVPKWLRMACLMLLPTLLAVSISVPQILPTTALKEQLIVLAGLLLGFLLVSPAPQA